jgi:hypothetical protein
VQFSFCFAQSLQKPQRKNTTLFHLYYLFKKENILQNSNARIHPPVYVQVSAGISLPDIQLQMFQTVCILRGFQAIRPAVDIPGRLY